MKRKKKSVYVNRKYEMKRKKKSVYVNRKYEMKRKKKSVRKISSPFSSF
jgi:hypothetical protein